MKKYLFFLSLLNNDRILKSLFLLNFYYLKTYIPLILESKAVLL